MPPATTFARAVSLAFVALACCACKARGGGGPSGSAGAPAGPAHKPDSWLVEGPRPAVRDASVKAAAGQGGQVEARLLVSKLTPADGVRVALRLSPAVGEGDAGPPRSPAHDWGETEASLVFTLRRPGGPDVVLQLASRPKSEPGAGEQVHSLTLSSDGLHEWGVVSPWNQPPNELLGRPGAYSLRIEGKLSVPGRPAEPFSLPPLPFQVVASREGVLPLGDLVARARAEASARGVAVGGVGKAMPEVVDDVSDGRWVRLSGETTEPHRARIVDALLSPSGQLVALRDWSRFTCVAEGTPIATPLGPRPVEQIGVGDRVWGLDIEHRTQVEVRVLRVESSYRDELVAVGNALFTPEHPVWLDGAWRPAAQARAGAEAMGQEGPIELRGASPVARHARVFDLTVSEPHTFFAGGLLVHNKAAFVPLAPGDPWGGLFLRATGSPPSQASP